MAEPINNDNDSTADSQTAYQGTGRAMSGRGTNLSLWGLGVALVFVAGLGIFVVTRGTSHTNPAPNGGTSSAGTATAPAPAQNNP